MSAVATFFFRENSSLPLELGAPLNDRIDKRHLEMNRVHYDSAHYVKSSALKWYCLLFKICLVMILSVV